VLAYSFHNSSVCSLSILLFSLFNICFVCKL
jgi:hypothetical protein